MSTVYATIVNDVQDLQQQIQNGFQMTQTTSGIFKQVSQSLFRHVVSCVEDHGGHSTHFL
jgi:hypothetical protein